MPKSTSIINHAAIAQAVGSKADLKAFLSRKENTAILLASAPARAAFIKELSAAGKSADQINRLLGQVARATVSTVDW